MRRNERDSSVTGCESATLGSHSTQPQNLRHFAGEALMEMRPLARYAPMLAISGGGLWALLPATSLLPWPDIFGLLTYVLPVVLIALAVVGLHQRHTFADGRRVRIGFATTVLGLAMMGLGNAIEIVSLASIGRENAFGHLVFFGGYLLVMLPGAVLLGLALRNAGPLPVVRLVGVFLMLVLPVSILLGLLASLFAPPSGDIAFWVTMSTGYGLVWVLLGLSLFGSKTSLTSRGA
jgi:hypothetical protein